jgi:hypothetical protein
MRNSNDALVLCLWLFMAIPVMGCASLSKSGDLNIPHKDQLYVSVFIDETEKGEVGLVLTDELRRKIYNRDPKKLAMFFDANAIIVDGTVLKLIEESVAPNAYQLKIIVEARLIAKDGTEVADLGRFSEQHTYKLERDVRRTDFNRQKAISLVVDSLAEQLLLRVNRAGEAEAPRDAMMNKVHVSPFTAAKRDGLDSSEPIDTNRLGVQI